ISDVCSTDLVLWLRISVSVASARKSSNSVQARKYPAIISARLTMATFYDPGRTTPRPCLFSMRQRTGLGNEKAVALPHSFSKTVTGPVGTPTPGRPYLSRGIPAVRLGSSWSGTGWHDGYW